MNVNAHIDDNRPAVRSWRAGAAILGLVGVACVAVLGGPLASPARAQRPTPTPSGTPSPTPSRTPDSTCSLTVRVDIEPRVFAVDETALVRVDAAYNFVDRRAPQALAVVVGPSGDERAGTARVQLDRLAGTIDFDVGARIAFVSPGAGGGPVQWHRGPGGRAAAGHEVASLHLGQAATVADWKEVIRQAITALAGVPPSLRTGLLVVIDELPPYAWSEPMVKWDEERRLLTDGLSQVTVLDIGRSSWLSPLTGAERDGLIFVAEHDGPLGPERRFEEARARITGLPGSWSYHVDLGDTRWASASLPPSPRALAIGDRMGVWADRVEAYRASLAIAFSVTPRTNIVRSSQRIVPLSVGTNRLSVVLGDGRTCLADVETGSVCVFRRNRRAADCGTFEAALPATAAPVSGTATPTAPSTGTPTPTSSASPPATSPPPPSPSRTPSDTPSDTPSPSPTDAPTAVVLPTPTDLRWLGSAWLPIAVRLP